MVFITKEQLSSHTLDDLQQYLLSRVAPRIPKYLREAFEAGVMEGPKTLLAKSLTPSPFQRRGVMMLGDSINMRHPVTGMQYFGHTTSHGASRHMRIFYFSARILSFAVITA